MKRKTIPCGQIEILDLKRLSTQLQRQFKKLRKPARLAFGHVQLRSCTYFFHDMVRLSKVRM